MKLGFIGAGNIGLHICTNLARKGHEVYVCDSEPAAQARAVAAGARRVMVMPYFLFPGRHWERDIPALVQDAARRHPGTEILVTAPVGLHPLMHQVVRERVEQCALHAAGGAPCELCAGTDRCHWTTGD